MSAEQAWRQLAQRTSRKINLGWWLQSLTTPLLITGLVIACGALVTRRELDSLPWVQVTLAAIAALFITAGLCWLGARSRFETEKQSLVRIEAAMRLRNALTAADHGVTAWPDVPAKINDGTSWHWKRILPPLLGTLLIIACGFIIPIHAKSDSPDHQEPSTWRDLDNSLEQLSHEDVVQEEYIDEMRKKLEKLREQSPDDWFSHSSLEATDNLKQNHQSEQESLKNNLQRAERNLADLQRGGANMNQKKKESLLNDFDQALQKMEQGEMKPNKELLKQLQQLDPKQLDNLTPEQMEKLRKNMRKAAQKLQQQGQGKEGEGEGDQEGEGEKEGEGEQREGPGKGGIQRGPGTAPNVLGDPSKDTGRGKLEKLESDDLDNALPGDLLQTHDGEHDVDKTQQGPVSGGSSSSKGKGGERVWKDSLLPEEKKALKKFFE